MIPKKIHYCWFGRGEKSKLAQKCINSWKKYAPDYEIVEWNEDNFDINLNDYTKFTYEHRMYAYLSDFVRLWAVERCGGVYFDTDVELISSLDSILSCSAYFGFESDEFVNTGIGFAAEAHHMVVQEMLLEYANRDTVYLEREYGEYKALTGSPRMNTAALKKHGLITNGMRQTVCQAEILPVEYLCPLNDLTGELTITSNTVSIHWYSKSANTKFAVIKSKFSRLIHRYFKVLRK